MKRNIIIKNKYTVPKINNNINNNQNINNDNTIYYILSSITFLQLYLPIVVYADRINIKNIFLIRQNSKHYVCPINNIENASILSNTVKKYKITTTDINQLNKLEKGILFIVDGDIYGPNEHNKQESIL